SPPPPPTLSLHDALPISCRSPNSRPPAYRPESSRQMSQRARSAALDAIPPAGEMLSTESSGTGCSVPSSTACGVAALRLDVKKAVVVPDSDMPSGVKMRFYTKSSQL